MNAPLDPVVAGYLSRNFELARRLAGMNEPNQLAAFERIRRWVDQQHTPAPVEGREGFTALLEILT